MEGPSPTAYPEMSRATTARTSGVIGVGLVAVFGVLGAMAGLGGLMLLGVVVGLPFALAAWYLAAQELKGIAAGIRDPQHRRAANTGRMLGMIGTALCVVAIVAWLGYAFVEAQDEVRKAEDLIRELESQPTP